MREHTKYWREDMAAGRVMIFCPVADLRGIEGWRLSSRNCQRKYTSSAMGIRPSRPAWPHTTSSRYHTLSLPD
jgi:hypothetical protein